MKKFFKSFVDWVRWEYFSELSLWLKIKFLARLVWAIAVFLLLLLPLLLVGVIIQSIVLEINNFIICTLLKDKFVKAVGDSVIYRGM